MTSERNARKTIDWEEIHRRLDTIRTAVDTGFPLTPERMRDILRRRAAALSREPETSRENDTGFDLVIFMLAHETYGIESAFVREVYPLRSLTPIPGAPAYVPGVTNVRGRILPVIDIKIWFGLPDQGLTDLNKVVILHNDRATFGILADLVLDVRTVLSSDLQSSLPTLTDKRAAYLKGITSDRLIVLDADRLLSDESFAGPEL